MGKRIGQFGVACAFVSALTAEAAAPRAYVSVNGSDANTCNVPATPCRTFVGAIGQVTSGGEVVVLDSGTFGGGSIFQAVTINAPAGVAALVATPITVFGSSASDVVTLRGITFVAPTPGSGTALTFNSPGGLNVENCVFHDWQYGINIVSQGKVHITDTTVRGSLYAISAVGGGVAGITADVTIERSRLLHNYSGVLAGWRSKVTVKDSIVTGSSGAGLLASTFTTLDAEMNVEDCVVSNNSGAGISSGTNSSGGIARLRISNSTVTNNGTGLAQYQTAVLLSAGTNTVEGNGTNTTGAIGSYTVR